MILMKLMRNLGLIELLLIGLLAFFAFNAWVWWNGGEIIRENTTIIIALATIIYATFTAFMFWNMKSSSEAQVRPLLFTSLKENMDLRIVNKMKQNGAKNVKIRVRVIPIKEDIQKSKFWLFIHKNLRRPIWNFFLDYSKSYKENYEIWDDDKSLSLSDYIVKSLSLKGDWPLLIITNALVKKGELHFKLLIQITYESLLDKKYSLNESYIISKSPSGTKMTKDWDYH